MKFLYKESESKKKYVFFWSGMGAGGEGRRGVWGGARVSECFTTNQNLKKIFFWAGAEGGGG